MLHAVSADGLELFFTRVPEIRADAEPRIWRSVRPSVREPFAAPRIVNAISGFAEAPTLSPDGSSLYYQALVNGRFVVFRLTREPKGAKCIQTAARNLAASLPHDRKR